MFTLIRFLKTRYWPTPRWKIKYEYGIRPVLAKFGLDKMATIDFDALVSAIETHLDETLTIYLDGEEKIRESAFVEVDGFLLKALSDTA